MVQAEKIRAHREELGLSVKEMSDAIGLGKEGDNFGESGKRGMRNYPKASMRR